MHDAAVSHIDLWRFHQTLADILVPGLQASHQHEIDEQIELPRSFIVPGGSPASAAIDMGRSAMRRAEREAVRLLDLEKLANPEVTRYLNRLTDFLFMLARFEDREDSFEALGSRARSK